MKFNEGLVRNNPLIFRWAFYLMVLAIGIIGLAKGVLSSVGSKDAQWYPASLLSGNIDFYNYYLEHYNDWFMRSVPNYYYQLYYLLQPLASLSWDTFKIIWFVLNASLLLLFLALIKKDFSFNYKQMALIFLPFFIGYPLISVFTNGQSTILLIVLIYLSWKFRENWVLLPIFLSLMTMKYSIGIPLVFGFLLMGYYRSVLMSGLITLIFPLIYSLQFNQDFLTAVFLPFKVSTDPAADALGGGPSDLMSLYTLFFDGPLIGVNALTITLLLLVSLFAFISLKYNLDKKTILLCSILLSLFGFYHNGHDYVMFLVFIPFVLDTKYFKFLYGYLLLFCFAPRLVRVFDLWLDNPIGVKEFMYNKYFVIFNVCFLITFFFLLIRENVIAQKKIAGYRYTGLSMDFSVDKYSHGKQGGLINEAK